MENKDDIINEIKEKSSDGDYIYRGEHKEHCKISSTLYREYIKINERIKSDSEICDLWIVQKQMLKVAKKHIGEPHQDIFEDKRQSITSLDPEPILTADEIELLTQLQHYGGDTNLIDFTTDYLIAIFFACSGPPTESGLVEDGRVIVIEKTNKIKKMIIPHRIRDIAL